MKINGQFYFVDVTIKNVAKNGNASQISDYHHPHNFNDPDKAFYAIDGNFPRDVHNNRTRCITLNEQKAWWQVDLMAVFNIISLSITTRFGSGRAPFLLFIYLFFTHQGVVLQIHVA